LSLMHSSTSSETIVLGDDESTVEYTGAVTIQRFLVSAGVNEADIKVVDLKNDFELASMIKSIANSLPNNADSPIVFVKGKYLGDEQRLRQIFSSGDIQSTIANILATQTDVSAGHARSTVDVPRLGMLDRTLENVETVFSYLNPVGWLRKANTTEKSLDVVEFDVIHTNWYWRNQKRKLQFHPQGFRRLHPTYGDVRSSQSYSDISKIEIKSPTLMIFHYKTSSSDWIKCSSKDQQEIISIIGKWAPQIQTVASL